MIPKAHDAGNTGFCALFGERDALTLSLADRPHRQPIGVAPLAWQEVLTLLALQCGHYHFLHNMHPFGRAPTARKLSNHLIRTGERDAVLFHAAQGHVLADFARRAAGIGDDARVAAFSIIGMCNWTAWWFNPEGQVSMEDVAAQIADMALSSVELPANRKLSSPGPSAILQLLRDDLSLLERSLETVTSDKHRLPNNDSVL
ncbi:hypothetical protein [Cupriavidus sp. 8B]